MPTFKDLLYEYDFPYTASWRLMTDGCQHHLGPKAFRKEFYQGMEAAFEYLCQNLNKPLTAELLEKIHDHVYQFEPTYTTVYERGQTQPNFRKEKPDPGKLGYRNRVAAEYKIFLAVEQLRDEADVSEEGIEEFVDELWDVNKNPVHLTAREYLGEKAVLNATEAKEKIKLPAWLVESYAGDSDELIKQMDKAELRKVLLEALRKFSLARVQNNISDPSFVRVLSSPLPRTEIIMLVNRTIEKANQSIKNAEAVFESEQQKRQAILKEIVKMTKSCQKGHYFKDGNGRTFVFGMTNFNLLKNGFGFAFINTPHHFSGFSSTELSREIEEGLAQFNRYKITAAKEYLLRLKSDSILNNEDDVLKELNATLASQPLIALEQLNEIYMRIKLHQMKVPQAPTRLRNNFITALFFTDDNQMKARLKIIELIKKIYRQKIQDHLKTFPSEDAFFPIDRDKVEEKVTANLKNIFVDTIENHSILKENVPAPVSSGETMFSFVSDEINNHFKKENKEQESLGKREAP